MDGAFGYYGKIPAQGDFLRKGLSPDFISRWDTWLQGVLVSGREALGNGWQDAYFSAPIWRFALPAGAIGATAAVGVLMPSVDRVGRQFPLTLACECDAPSAWAAYQSASALFIRLEDLALGMLEDTAATADLAEGLAQLTLPLQQTALKFGVAGSAMTMSGGAVAEDALIAAGMLSSYGHATCLWVASIDGIHRVMVTSGLPEGVEEACALMDSSHSGWAVPKAPLDLEELI
ncbi:MAG: type VI secretion system-associated protein TagF [Pseudomonadota bacterium]